jgi:L-alanine-DL-glutamate epimerase-like enolase superfamily enzyme
MRLPAVLSEPIPNLRITDIRNIRLRVVKEVGSVEPAWNVGGSMSFRIGGGSFVEIRTNQDLVGIGPGIGQGSLERVRAILVGEDPFDIERHFPRLRYYAWRALAGIDIALWDLVGKATDKPLYKLLGGAKSRVPAYASLIRLSTPEERAQMAVQLSEEGWTAIKLRLHHNRMREDIRTVEAVREAVGDGIEIMTDANQAQSTGNWQPGVLWDFRRAVETARELQRLDCYWLEEPLRRYEFSQLAELNRLVELPIAGGENNRGIHEFLRMLQEGVYDILQPEGMGGGEGITGLQKIRTLAEAYGKRAVPHHGGGGLGTIAHLHLVAAWRNAPYLELLHDPPIASYLHGYSIMEDPPLVENGWVTMPEKPGLGVEIEPGMIEQG